ncbi:hypothetical protein [Clostridium cellulovorans]|uniref:Ribosomal RNA large subunit methyltransferase K/L-like methyltransferase domain-containing protein n=2 Tax=Clostridium cellulovorans TaxID=1493 RepID=D9SP59_CLOC7|nr:hypothetical protein [Clostridium cellulovorans]AAN32824.1 hypothetical protein [Clostridium cellulovorans]ADL52024.1 hypothetical protein Clocel_2298 [Clostridium cellulovorans 743B]
MDMWQEEFENSVRHQVMIMIDEKLKSKKNQVNNERYYKSHNRNSFFNDIFRKYGAVYSIIFRQGLAKTNIQYAELFSLLKNCLPESCTSVEFMGDKGYIDKINSLIECFFNDNYISNIIEIRSYDHKKFKEMLDERITAFSELYSSLFKNLVSVTFLYNSCILFLPSAIEIDDLTMKKICALSGYIHSIGRSIFVRNLNNVNEDFFYSKLRTYLKNIYGNLNNIQEKEEKIRFIPFAYEDFLDDELSKSHSELDALKFHMEKLYLGKKRITEVLEDIEKDEQFKKTIKVGTPYNGVDGDVKQEHCIWMCMDCTPEYNINQSTNIVDTPVKSKNKYLICYDQFICNKNEYYIFNENMPGWYDNVTIPHTLMAAMINLTGINRLNNSNRKINILDPFVGAGTSYFQAAKFQNINFTGFDKNSTAIDALRFNKNFFEMDTQKIDRFIRLLYKLLIILNNNQEFNVSSLFNMKSIEENELWSDIMDDKNQRSFSEELLSYCEKYYSFFNKYGKNLIIDNLELIVKNVEEHFSYIFNRSNTLKILKFLTLKAVRRHGIPISRNRYDSKKALYIETKLLIKSIYRYRIAIENRNNCDGEAFEKLGLGLMTNKYSLSTHISENYNYNPIFQVGDCRKCIDSYSNMKYDLIITDPPYGFNTDEDIIYMSNLYKDIIKRMIEKLNRNGQIIMCLPATSYTGRNIEYFTQANIVPMQVIDICKNLNNPRSLKNDAHLNLPPKNFFKPPYYWESGKSLRRHILHFTFD